MKIIDAEKLKENIIESMENNPHTIAVVKECHRNEHMGFLNMLHKQPVLNAIVLPCNIGDKVYVIPSETNYGLNKLHRMTQDNRVHTQVVSGIRFYSNNEYMLTTCDGLCNCLQRFLNESWFLTQKEAEEKLNELKESEESSGNN